MTKIYLIAGENSGDFIGSKIMYSLKAIDSNIDFLGIGGNLMEDQGLNSLFEMSKINLMGFAEIIPHIFKLKKLINITINDIIEKKPDIVITIDSPGFTFRVAKTIKSLTNIKLLHIVAPSVWAYKPSRAKKYATIYDHLLVLFPFEPKYFITEGLECTYIGHPFLEQNFYPKQKQDYFTPTICVTAGSRNSEIKRLMPIFVKALELVYRQYSNLTVIFPIIEEQHKNLILSFLDNVKFKKYFTYDRLEVFSKSDIALAKSGTNTLEIAASHTPQIVAYKINLFSYYIIRLLIKIKYVSLINIVANKEILPEFLQFNCTAQKIATTLIYYLSNPQKCTDQIEASDQIIGLLKPPQDISPSAKAANIIIQLLNKK